MKFHNEKVTWKRLNLESLEPKILLAQVAARFSAPTIDDGRFRHQTDPQYDAKLLALLDSLKHYDAQFLIFPEYAWPYRLAASLFARLAAMPDNTVCITPFEHLAVSEFAELLRVFEVATRKQDLEEVAAALEGADPKWSCVNVAICSSKDRGAIKSVPQLKMMPAALEESAALGRWKFVNGARRRIFFGKNVRFAISLCFDFIAQDRGTTHRLRDLLREADLDLLLVPECNPQPFHGSYARGIIDLNESSHWASSFTKTVFVNLARGTVCSRLSGPDNALGYSRVIGDLGTCSPPAPNIFELLPGVVAARTPSSLRALLSSRERLNVPGLSQVVVRPHESLVSIRLPAIGTAPSKDVTGGRLNTSIELFRPLDAASGKWTRIPGNAPSSNEAPSGGIPEEYLVKAGLIGADDLRGQLSSAISTTAGPIAIIGDGGSGKTALVANILALDYVEGDFARIAWVDVGRVGADDEALRDEVLVQLGVPLVPGQDAADRWASLAKAFRSRPTILVLDSYELGRGVAPLPDGVVKATRWPGRVIVTSRAEVNGVDISIDVPHLDAAAATALIARESEGKVTLEDASAFEEVSGGSPLACVWVGAILRENPVQQKALMAEVASGKISTLETLFSWLVRGLAEHDRDVLLVIGQLKAAAVGDVADILSRPPATVEAAIEELRRRRLIMGIGANDAGRNDVFQVRHPFIAQFSSKAFISELKRLEEAVLHWAGHLVSTNGGDRNWHRYQELSSRWDNLRVALRWAEAAENPQFLVLWRGLDYFLWTTGRWAERIALAERAVKFAKNAGEKGLEAHALFDSIAETRWHVEASTEHVWPLLEEAKKLYDEVGDFNGVAMTEYYRSRLLRKERSLDDARKVAEALLAGLKGADFDRVRALTLNSLGNILRDLKETEEAFQRYSEARYLFGKLSDEEMLAVVLRNEGRCHLMNGQYGAALQSLEDAMAAFRQLEMKIEYAEAVNWHAQVLARLGELDEAQDEVEATARELRLLGSDLRDKEMAETLQLIQRIRSELAN